MIPVDEQIKVIAKGADEIITLEDLKAKLERARKENKPLIVKLGLDPSAPDIHLGHAVVLRKIRQFQDLGHKAVIIIGDFTGMIGDPTGRSKTRRQLSREEVLENAKTYERQIFRILDKNKTEVRFNSEWLGKLTFADVISLTSKYTVARMLEREDFKNRFDSHESIGIHEFFYPLMQGYDSVELKADVELGGTDQRFNILMGRTLQKDYGQESQVAVLMPILEGTDGVEKMSKSLGNYIGINEAPEDMYGKVMSIPDGLIIKYYELATDVHPDEVKKIKTALETNSVNPRDVKMKLAHEITRLYHGETAADEAREHFVSVFQKKEIPGEVPVLDIGKDREDMFINGRVDLIKVIVAMGFAPSNSEARRLVSQGAVKINGERVKSMEEVVIRDGDIIQSGKRNFVKVRIFNGANGNGTN
ncbi:MAG: tyrosine--tRNA ligase [Clostridiaceae bacterium]|nr:tyrosine--tRNA ligase [Clostridiaceae bacterium]